MNFDAHAMFLAMIVGVALFCASLKAASLRPSVGAATLPPITPSPKTKELPAK